MLLSKLLSSLVPVPISGQGPLFSVVAVLCTRQSEISNCISLFFAKARLNVQTTVDIEIGKTITSVISLNMLFKLPFWWHNKVYRRSAENQNKKSYFISYPS